MRLSRTARERIKWAGLRIVDYTRTLADLEPDDWRGDACGCTEDRCVGYHHDGADECGCLPVLIEDAYAMLEVRRA